MFIREKRTLCGSSYQEIDIYPCNDDQKKRKRGKKKNVSLPKQKNLNDKKSKRYFGQLLNANFTDKDLHGYFSYSTENHPSTIEEAEKNIKNYIRKVNYQRKKLGLEKARYITVLEYDIDREGRPKHIHHHLIIDGELSRDQLEDLWRRKREKGQKKGKKIGRTNVRHLEPDQNGLIGLAMYLSKRDSSKRKWSPSLNLKKPVEMPPADRKYTRGQIDRIARGDIDKDYWNKKYQGWSLTDSDYGFQVKFNMITGGYHILLRLRKNST